jgi:hypothetical protein
MEREKKFNRIIGISSLVESIFYWIAKNWVKYILIKNVFYFTALPIIIGLLFLNPYIAFGYLIIFFLVFLSSFSFDAQRVLIAEGDPRAFIQGEKIESDFAIIIRLLMFVAIGSLYGLVFVALSLNSLSENKDFVFPSNVTLFFASFLVFAFLSSTPLLINGIESSIFIKNARTRFPQWKIPEYFPSEQKRAWARFFIASNSLTEKLRRKAMKEFSLFREGIEIFDAYLKTKFSIALCEPERFFRYAKFKAFFTEDSKCVLDCLQVLINLTEKTDLQPCDFVKSLKKLLNEPTSDDDLIDDVEIDNKRIRQVLSKRNEFLTIWVAPLIVTILGGVILYLLRVT